MQEKVNQILQSSRLCKNMSEKDVQQLLKDYHSEVKQVKKGTLIFSETDKPQKIFVLISGSVMVAKNTVSGKRMIIAQIEESGEMFGEVYAFMELDAYDMYAEATEDSVIMTLDNGIFMERETAPFIGTLQHNLMTIFAKKAYIMNGKLRILGGANIREKIVRFLFERQSKNGVIQGNLSREDMADSLNVTRPSLSRELSKMQEEGIIRIEKREIVIADQEEFESYL